MKNMEWALGLVVALAVLCAANARAAEPIFLDDFGTSASQVDTQKWQPADGKKMPHMDWPDDNPNNAYVGGGEGEQFVTVKAFGDAPVSAEFELSVWNVREGGSYNLFGFVTPDSIWKSNNAIGWRITTGEGKIYAQPYTTCHEGEVPGWHEHGGKAIEMGAAPAAKAKLRVDWQPGVSAAFYINGELQDTLTQDIAKVPMRFGTDVQGTSWIIDNVKISPPAAEK